MPWGNKYPILKIFLPFLFGIIIGFYITYDFFSLSIITIAVLIFGFIAILLLKKYSTYHFRWLDGVISSLVFIILGLNLCVGNKEINNPKHFNNFQQKETQYIYKIIESVEEKKRSYKTTAEVIAFNINNKWQLTEGKAIVYITKDSASKILQYGDVIYSNTAPTEVKPPANPNEFNYKNYLASKNIYHQVYLSSNKWILLKNGEGNIFKNFSLQLRNKLLQIFQKNNVEGEDYAVVSALILGYDDKIDAELLKSYSNAGITHILSVSGMHVAVIYGALLFIFGFIERLKKLKYTKPIILLSFIWFYAMLTGLSPSVMRSAAMISFVIIGQSLNRKVDIYNSLIVSAFFLLAIDPFFLKDVGFQLSYLALFGIIWLQPYIAKWWQPQNKIIKSIWTLINVSIAAQLITTPICLFYFHQFPNYFLLANLIIVPLSTVIIYAAIGILIFSPISIVSEIFGSITAFLINKMNIVIRFIEQLPYSTTNGIWINTFEMTVIYVFIFSLIFYFIYYKVKYIYISLASILTLVIFNLNLSINKQNEYKLNVYAVKKHTAIEFTHNNNQILLIDSIDTEINSKLKFHLQNNWIKNNIENPIIKTFQQNKSISNNHLKLFYYKDFMLFNDIKLLRINKESNIANNKTKINVDYIILSQNQPYELAFLSKLFNCKNFIIDSSNSFKKTREWTKECENLALNYHNVNESGAFQLSL